MISISRSKYRGIINISSLLTAMRWPNLIIIVITQYFTALFLIGDFSEWKSYIFDWRLSILAFSTICVAAAGYLINDYYDIKIDYINKPEKVIIGKIIKRRVALAIHMVVSGIGVVAGTLVSPWIGAVNFLAVFLLWIYSNQLKRMPLVGNFIVAILTGLSVAIVSLLYWQFEILVYIYAMYAFSITLIREIIKDMEDLKGDANHGCKTLPIIFGIRKTKNILYLIIAGFMVSLVLLTIQLNNDHLDQYLILYMIPMFYFIYQLAKSDSKKNFNYLSNFCKVLMITGILSMIFFK